MSLSKRDREFRLPKISYLDFKHLEMDRVLTAFFYYGLMRAGQALGESGTLPPVVAAWAANVLFGGVAATLLLQAQRR